MTKDRVLVVLPTLGNRQDLLERSLASVADQGDVARCVVVSPTNSGVQALAERFGADWVADPARGIAAAVNVGLAERQGEEFYAWMGDDDLFRPGALEHLVGMLDRNPDAVLASGACDYILESGEIIATNTAGRWGRFLLSWGPDLIPHPGTIVRLDQLETIGGFDESLRFTLDLDAFLKLAKRGRFVFTSRVVSAFCWHPNSLTVSDRRGSSREAMEVKKRNLSGPLRPFHWLWNYPVAWASAVAARILSIKATTRGRNLRILG